MSQTTFHSHFEQVAEPKKARRCIPTLPILCFRSEVRYAVTVSLVWLFFYNGRFWSETLHTMWRPSAHAAAFVVSLFILSLTLQSMLLLLAPSRTLMRAAAGALFLIAAASAYFSSTFGVVMNREMMRNLVQTDVDEVVGLVNLHFWLHLLVLGAVPAAIAWRVRIASARPGARLRARVMYILAGLALSAGGVLMSSADFAVFLRAHKPIRYLLTPAAPVSSALALIAAGEGHASGSLLNPAGRSERAAAPHARPLALFLVIGETARAANFSLAGYVRPTNPRLQKLSGL
ncbi:MAG TPA: phosphoethanolamine transferase domain-containing protein, partial [Steroidobacter sp.]|nr:phosphoethanolamine transferase domain-containing protein [Steroidobacter sp.]